MRAEIGPIWRSIRRHRAFWLLVMEVVIGFYIVGSLLMTCRWYAAMALPPPGHRQEDVVELDTRGPASDDAIARASREILTLEEMSGVRKVVPISATQIDDRWSMPSTFWTTAGAAVGPSTCPNVARMDGVVIGWSIEAGAALADTIDLRFIEGDSPARLSTEDQSRAVVITRCLRDALFGTAPASGQTLFSNQHPPARIVGVIEDARFHVPFLFQTQVNAIFVGAGADPREGRYLIRTEPGGAEYFRAHAPAELQRLDPERLVVARLFSAEQSRAAGIAWGTVLVLVVVGGGLAVVAVLGNLAVAAFLVADRRRVLGVRRALGATRWDVFRYLILENLIPTQLGNAIGLLAVLVSLPAVQQRFSGIHFLPSDALITAVLLSLGGIAAKLLPALKATRIPPSEVTRSL